MREKLSSLLMVRSIAYIVFGFVALIWPGVTLVTLAMATAIWLLVAGVMGTFTSINSREEYRHWVLRLMLSLLQIGAGAYLVQRPGITISTYVFIIGIAFVVEGLADLAELFMTKKMEAGMMLLNLVMGTLSVVAGLVIWRYPVSGSLSFVWVVGLAALVNGVMGLILSAEEKK